MKKYKVTTQYRDSSLATGTRYEAKTRNVEADTFELNAHVATFFDDAGKPIAAFADVIAIEPEAAK